MYTYANVEDALAEVFKLNPSERGALRGRLKHFQVLGISPASPGKGKRISYTNNDARRWAFCLELSQFGLDPKAIAKMVEIDWGRISDHMENKADKTPAFYYFSPYFFSPDWPKLLPQSHARTDRNSPFYFSAMGETFDKTIHANDGDEMGKLFAAHFQRRFGSISLSQLFLSVDRALGSRK